MKKNSGSAITSVIVVFLLVTMIGVPLLGMVVYNYRLREYDSGTKEAEYKNEVVMDRISTIIKNEVIAAISEAKNISTDNISAITDTLVNSYNGAYDEAIDAVAEYDENENITNVDAVKAQIKENLKGSLGDYDGVDKASVVEILALDEAENLENAQINNENLKIICNSMFQKKYQDIVVSKLFDAIYEKDEYSDLVAKEDNIVFGKNDMPRDAESNAVLPSSLKIMSKYKPADNGFEYTYEEDNDNENSESPYFDEAFGELQVGIESVYKLNSLVPLTTLSATYVITTPEFDMISSIEQQSMALSNPTLDYSIIVGETLTVNDNVKVQVDGNVLARANGVVKTEDEVKETGISLKSGATLSEEIGERISSGRIATPGDILMEVGTTLVSGTNPVFYRNLYIGKPDETAQKGNKVSVTFNGDVLAKDDLEINIDSEVSVEQTSGTYFGYNDKNDEGPDSSSAIVINSDDVSNLTIKLKNLYLAGRAFIDGVKSTVLKDEKTQEPRIYKTGESISIKGNYIAYQTPLVNTGDYDSDGVTGDYDVNKVKFSPYFLTGKKDGIVDDTHLTMNLVDNFVTAISYEDFDSQNKWQYFKAYALQNEDSIIKPKELSVETTKYIEGIGMNNGEIVDHYTPQEESTFKVNKANRFTEFTEFFGYYPKDETKRKSDITEWVNFGSKAKMVGDGNFFTYISSDTASSKTLAWGSSVSGVDIPINVPSDSNGVNGIIIHKGDLTITSNCSSDIPFRGMIIVTGNLTIEGDVTVISDKDAIASIVMENYLGNDYVYTEDDNSVILGKGDLLNAFTYDDSGTTYVAIDVSDRSNMIDINTLVGIKDWKKQRYGRL